MAERVKIVGFSVDFLYVAVGAPTFFTDSPTAAPPPQEALLDRGLTNQATVVVG